GHDPRAVGVARRAMHLDRVSIVRGRDAPAGSFRWQRKTFARLAMVALQEDPGSRRARTRAPGAGRVETFPAARSCDARVMRRGQPSGGQPRTNRARENRRRLHGAKYRPRSERPVCRRIRTDPRRTLTVLTSPVTSREMRPGATRPAGEGAAGTRTR